MALISNDGGPEAISLLMVLNSHNSRIGNFVGCALNTATLNYTIKSSNGMIVIPRTFFENFKTNKDSISTELFIGLANRFVPEK